MPEYIYALHDFQPEHEDEIAFRAGETIEVIEKDDQYNDGWWQGRNAQGKAGLFPSSYTTSTMPLPPSAPITVATNPWPSNQADITSFSGNSTAPKMGVANGVSHPPEQEEVMKATISDVQKAIEQLGNDADGARSFSFASTRDGDTDRETDGAETDGEIGVTNGGDDWHRTVRDKLAQEARKVVQEKAATQQQIFTRTGLPIDVEVSDESDGEEDNAVKQHLQHLRFTRDHPHIPEEDEEEEEAAHGAAHTRKDSTETSSVTLPCEDASPQAFAQKEDCDVHAAALLDITTPPASNPSSFSHSTTTGEKRSPQSLPTPTSPLGPKVVSCVPIKPISATMLPLPSSPASSTGAIITSNPARDGCEIPNGLPSPALTTVGSQRSSGEPYPTVSSAKPTVEGMQLFDIHPTEWSVEHVVQWLKSKGFPSGVQDRFSEQEISGDVLFMLTPENLKDELGIAKLGTRIRILNAINELSRSSSDNQILLSVARTPSQSLTPLASSPYPYAHARNGSTGVSMHGSSLSTSVTIREASPGPIVMNDTGNSGSPTAPKRTSSTAVSVMSGSLRESTRRSVEYSGVSAVAERPALLAMTGLGLGLRSAGHLAPCPSDPTVNKQIQGNGEESNPIAEDEDRGAMSDGETPPSSAKQRRRFFSRSSFATSSKDKLGLPSSSSKDGPGSRSASPLPKRMSSDDTVGASRPSRSKRTTDTKGTERLSFLGNTFPTSIGKSRKPVPKVISTTSADQSTDNSASLTFSRLVRKPISRPSTATGLSSPSQLGGDSGATELVRAEANVTGSPTGGGARQTNSTLVRRNRRLSTSGVPRPIVHSPTPLATGKSVIEQIGEADHDGWMRKKGEHYNSWKRRYLIIKGPHLYILRNDSKLETKIKGYIDVSGYKVITDESIDPGRYSFKIVHQREKTHFFSSDEILVVRGWVKAITRATITRDYSMPVISSVNIPTIPLSVAQAMNPAPRPPSPTARDAVQRALRREKPEELLPRDVRVLMGFNSPETPGTPSFPSPQGDANGIASDNAAPSPTKTFQATPPRPFREVRQISAPNITLDVDRAVIDWANGHLPLSLRMVNPTDPIFGGLAILRLSERVFGKTVSPPLADTAFPSGPNDDTLDGLFRLFDFLMDNGVTLDGISLNDVRQGKRDKVMQLLKNLKTKQERLQLLLQSMGQPSQMISPFMALSARG